MDKKEQRRAVNAIEKIAARDGKTVSFVCEEMKKAIDIGWNNEDPEIQKYWRKVAKGKKPSVEEFILFVIDEAKKKKFH